MAKIKGEKIQVVFLGTPEFACPSLMALIQMRDFEVAAVITQPDKPAGRNLDLQRSNVKVLAEDHLKTLPRAAKKFPIYTPGSVNAPEFLAVLEKMHADVAVVVAYGQILSPAFLKTFRKGAVNVHGSLLPRWRGAAPIAWALLNQDTVTGVTLQKVAQKLDSGDIISSNPLALDETWDASTLYTELSKRGADLIKKHLLNFVNGNSILTPQDESMVTTAPKIKKEQGKIDWEKSAMEICAQIRALTPWPGTWTFRDGEQLKILRAAPTAFSGGEPGQLVGTDKLSFWVQCGQGTAIKISVVQPQSRARMAAAEYMRGYPFEKGDKLG